MCDWVTLLYSRKLTEYGKPAIMKKKLNKNDYKNLKKSSKIKECQIFAKQSIGVIAQFSNIFGKYSAGVLWRTK